MKPLFLPFAYSTIAVAQSFVSPPNNVEVVLSEKFPGSSISYKQVNNLCETTEGVRSFSGHVRMPKSFIPDATQWTDGMSANFFFWYFEARNNPENAPTSIYLGGGPGYTSFDGSSVFPCYVNPDSNSTTLNEHSWNNNVNMLYIDQPLGVGFSYTYLVNGTLDLVNRTLTPVESDDDEPEWSLTTLPATIQPEASDITTVTNTTASAARSLWRFAQVWFNEFPEIITLNDELSVWAVSYGGLYAPVLTSYFLDQNALIEDGEHELKNATTFNMATVGVINALVDMESMALGLVTWANNNTYGLKTMPDEVVEQAIEAMNAPEEGCYALINACRAAAAEGDPDNVGNNENVNKICAGAVEICTGATIGAFNENSPNFHFDITFNKPGTFPNEYETALFNQRWVQEELGMPLNFTRGRADVEMAFLGLTGDTIRYGLEYLSHALDSGVNVAMVYGDRDFRCNWVAGENASMHIPFDHTNEFAAAGYESIITNSSYEGGLVREYGSLSFSRVFQAGHSAGSYQPETMSVIFERAMFRNDVATGAVDLIEESGYGTSGPSDVRNVTNELPDPIVNICYVLDPAFTCTEEQLEALLDGTAETKDWVVTSPAGSKGSRLNQNGEGSGNGNRTESGGENEESQGEGEGDKSAGAKTMASFLAAALPVAFLFALQTGH